MMITEEVAAATSSVIIMSSFLWHTAARASHAALPVPFRSIMGSIQSITIMIADVDPTASGTPWIACFGRPDIRCGRTGSGAASAVTLLVRCFSSGSSSGIRCATHALAGPSLVPCFFGHARCGLAPLSQTSTASGAIQILFFSCVRPVLVIVHDRVGFSGRGAKRVPTPGYGM